MFDEAEFQRIATALIADMADAIEEADQSGVLECELQAGVLTITSEQGKSWVVSKHGPSKQLWLASPFSGGLHFSYDGSAWTLADGRELRAQLVSELARHGGLKVAL